MIRMTTDPIDPDALRRELFDPAAGGYCAFEGWVRNHNEGQEVLRHADAGQGERTVEVIGESLHDHGRDDATHVVASDQDPGIGPEALQQVGAQLAHVRGTALDRRRVLRARGGVAEPAVPYSI